MAIVFVAKLTLGVFYASDFGLGLDWAPKELIALPSPAEFFNCPAIFGKARTRMQLLLQNRKDSKLSSGLPYLMLIFL